MVVCHRIPFEVVFVAKAMTEGVGDGRTGMNVERGKWVVIRCDGSQEEKTWSGGKATTRAIHAAIGCDCCDTVVLRKSKDMMEAEIVMMVDDTGMIDGKPVNPKATDLYHSVRRTPYSIHGDVAIVNDADFG